MMAQPYRCDRSTITYENVSDLNLTQYSTSSLVNFPILPTSSDDDLEKTSEDAEVSTEAEPKDSEDNKCVVAYPYMDISVANSILEYSDQDDGDMKRHSTGTTLCEKFIGIAFVSQDAPFVRFLVLPLSDIIRSRYLSQRDMEFWISQWHLGSYPHWSGVDNCDMRKMVCMHATLFKSPVIATKESFVQSFRQLCAILTRRLNPSSLVNDFFTQAATLGFDLGTSRREFEAVVRRIARNHCLPLKYFSQVNWISALDSIWRFEVPISTRRIRGFRSLNNAPPITIKPTLTLTFAIDICPQMARLRHFARGSRSHQLFETSKTYQDMTIKSPGNESDPNELVIGCGIVHVASYRIPAEPFRDIDDLDESYRETDPARFELTSALRELTDHLSLWGYKTPVYGVVLNGTYARLLKVCNPSDTSHVFYDESWVFWDKDRRWLDISSSEDYLTLSKWIHSTSTFHHFKTRRSIIDYVDARFDLLLEDLELEGYTGKGGPNPNDRKSEVGEMIEKLKRVVEDIDDDKIKLFFERSCKRALPTVSV